MENPAKMDDDWGYPYDLGNHYVNVQCTTVLQILVTSQ